MSIKSWVRSLWGWAKGKVGRITTALGAVFVGLDVVDLNPIKPALTDLVGDHLATKIVSGVAVFFFILSFIRHQMVANRNPVQK